MEILGDILLKHICVAGKIVRAIAHSLLRNYALDIIFEKYKFNANVYKQHDYIINKLYRGNRPVMERFREKIPVDSFI